MVTRLECLGRILCHLDVPCSERNNAYFEKKILKLESASESRSVQGCIG